ncbi:MAG TPA: tRNA (adenosine(37)-N6)-threonylcarbamoyltransferase complex ATPase subunit type 1 TsaE [Geobacteraceae bacterium]|jgi:tRNA threonylcarbamoyladenosine biosynthesis protein TsaE|nr:tRNA (adenosine(37)-N6)-threonylcarbamoyltransferase complex ATPase subunit type 1 TsaE [Geobacteraceae bacterium]
MFSVVTRNENETRALGEKVGALLRPGNFVALYGDLGSGKTRFAQGVALGAGVKPDTHVTSPTYTILNEYKGAYPVYHFDLYRLGGDADIAELGFEEYFYGDGICLVEWPERLACELPDQHLKVYFYHGEGDTRRIEFDWRGEFYEEILRSLFR